MIAGSFKLSLDLAISKALSYCSLLNYNVDKVLNAVRYLVAIL
nr:MAG TPA: hypothetical protein [Bacteriophage sp.]